MLSSELQESVFHHPLLSIAFILSLSLLARFSVLDPDWWDIPYWIVFMAGLYYFRNEIIISLERSSSHRYYGWFFLTGVFLFTYYFIGVFGAGVVVDFFEVEIFGKYVTPTITGIVDTVLPYRLAHEILVDANHGVITVALTYSFAIILPIVGVIAIVVIIILILL